MFALCALITPIARFPGLIRKPAMQALVDTCHSGSLPDLPHHHCNSAYVPWRSKGKRRTNSRQNVTGAFTILTYLSRHIISTPIHPQCAETRRVNVTFFDTEAPSSSLTRPFSK